MSGSGEACDGPSPPLPPPPPPPPVGDRTLPAGLPVKLRPSLPSSTREPREEVRLLLGQLRHSLIKQGIKPDELVFVSHYEPVPPMIQEGPMCGLVAMCMASQYLGTPVTIDEALEAARSRKYTIQGEMFSAAQVGELASDLCGCEHVVTSGEKNRDHIIQGLKNHCAILIPYDADRNNEPGLKNGHKAHWAVLSGILRAYSYTAKKQLCKLYEQDESIVNLFHAKNAHENTSVRNVQQESVCTGDKVEEEIFESILDYVFAKQGKSAHTKLWALEQLLESNRNLLEVGDQILEDETGFVVPEQGIDKTLCDFIVTLQPAK